MRLSKIKLCGFKSFVDATTFLFPSNLIGILGPNGCGKSNVIDAVRWVMGESSAKTLRGGSMADVIFNGSSARKPVGQAWVELVFDNSDGRIAGPYSRYHEISLRRQVSRDGQSSYFLNGTRCRRRDIADVFMGTGFGPRSYSIIEQGMISRLIEARPEDLRLFLEEAAGISRYKERRKETEGRIHQTRENLARLNDVRDELGKQLDRLQRQAEAAVRYKELKTEERQVSAQLQALRWRVLDQRLAQQHQLIRAAETAVEAEMARLRGIETDLEHGRETQRQANEELNRIQGRVYGIGAEIARVEQALFHARERRRAQQQDLAQVLAALDQARGHLQADQRQIEELGGELAHTERALGDAQRVSAQNAAAQSAAERAMAEWQAQWEAFNRRAVEPGQTAQVERARLTQLEQQLNQQLERRERLTTEAGALDPAALEREVSVGAQAMAAHEDHHLTLEQELEDAQATIARQRDDNHAVALRLDQERSALQRLRGRLASLETLQQAALGKGKGGAGAWVERHGLQDSVRLAERLDVAAGWERAVEVVLGPHLEALCLSDIAAVADLVTELEGANLSLFDTQARAPADPPSGTASRLLERVRAPWSLAGVLSGVWTARDLGEALALRQHLASQESVVTPDGLWLGRDWLRVVREPDEHSGVLVREHEIRALRTDQAVAEEGLAVLLGEAQEGRVRLADLERARDETQAALRDSDRAHAEIKSRLGQQQARLDQMRIRAQRIEEELGEVAQHIHDSEMQSRQARTRLHGALAQMEALAEQRQSLERLREEHRDALEQSVAEARQARDHEHALALEVRTLGTRLSATQQNLERARVQVSQLDVRCAELQSALAQSDAPITALEQEREERLAQRLAAEAELARARQGVEDVDRRLRELERARHEVERLAQENRDTLENLRLARQELDVRCDGLLEQVTAAGFELPVVVRELPTEATEEQWQERLERLGRQIQRLGPINLAAIDEFQSEAQRKAYLDAQHGDLIEALATLEGAIRKIDGETRNRFRETFEKVNVGLQATFPRLFGGGHAYLELTGEELLDAGVTVMARPPGKRNSTIHLLSGGEKALTAVALVFAIFALNPAPVCLLDEVDAPLDEANVGRFCQMVSEMSQRVQFIFITHNKTTMEMADHLTGVTMQEPGVSRLVAVDVAEAVELAAM